MTEETQNNPKKDGMRHPAELEEIEGI